LVVPVFVPAAAFGLAQGAAIPVVAFSARSLGASLVLASVVVALFGIGQVAGAVPAGRAVRRLGERRAVVAGSLFGAVGAGLCLAAWTVPVLALGVLLTGIAAAVWGLARHAYVAYSVPPTVRARALAAMATSNRIGLFAGPLLGAAVVRFTGPRGAFAIELAGILLAAALMARLPDLEHDVRIIGTRGPSFVTTIRRHRRVLGTLGVAVLFTGAARGTRNVTVPVWAAHIGLGAATTSLIVGIAAGLEMLVAYPGGRLMDLRGRRFVAVPCLLLLGLGQLLLPATIGPATLTATALVMGVGSGLSTGLVMTLGADVAPAQDRAEFLAAWRLCHDSGLAAGPALVSAIGALGSLGAGISAIGVLALGGAVIYARAVPPHREAAVAQ
jgi:MFS family permease